MTLTGGPVFWILVTLAVVAVVTYFERLMDLRRAHIDYQDFLDGVVNVLDAGNVDEALAICEDTPAPVAQVVATAIRHRGGSARQLRDAVDSQGRAEVGRLDRRLAALAIIAQTAPSIGLLGTIIGFIKTVIAANSQALVSRADLFNGSMEALVSAALGLMVAIPATVMYGSLRVRLDRTVVELEAAASRIVGYLSALKEKTR
ncbi:MAG: MotA/TolQ/ExbB proton channel family protein [Kiritimatiellae bacterium]|nr:MotA/TolQ/ExbB proton channel family protein [Kiritimatiellia bacterium]